MRFKGILSLGLTPLAAHAEPVAPSWSEILNLDTFVARLLQSGLAAARTQVDLTYDELKVAGGGQLLTLSGLDVYPILESGDPCLLSVDRATITLPPVTEINSFFIRVDMIGAAMDVTCLPAEARGQVALLFDEVITLDHAVISMTYDFPSAGALINVHAASEGNLEASLAADLDYFSMDGTQDEPLPVVFLKGATLTVQDLGAWGKVRGILPPPFTNSTGMAALIPQQLASMIVSLPGEGELALSPAEEVLAASAGETAKAFLDGSGRAILALSPEEPAFVDFEFYEDNPRVAIEELAPLFRTVAAAVSDRPALALMRDVLSGAETDVDARVAVGEALLTGVGAPRNVTQALETLLPVWEEIGTETRLALVDALPLTPETYERALETARDAGPAAAPLLGKLEADLPLGDILQVQGSVSGDMPLAEATASAQRNRAIASISGHAGITRNYRDAALAATLAVALGDSAAASLLSELETRFGHDPAWRAAMDDVSSDALEIWLSDDFLPPAGQQ